MNERGDIVGRYQTADSTTAFHAFLLSGFQPGCVTNNRGSHWLPAQRP